MTKYDIPLRVKLSNKEYDKVKDADNVSAFVRKAINFYDFKQPREIELTKKKLLNEIINDVEEKHEKFLEEVRKNEEKIGQDILDTLTQMSDKCDEELMRLNKESSNCENIVFETFDTQTSEEKILSILPTLQGIYHSEKGMTYESIRKKARDIGISAKELKDWIDNNPELINETDYLYRPRYHNIGKRKRHTFEY